MQECKKKIILDAIAKTVKRLRNGKSQYMLSAEYDIPYSVVNSIEKGIKDPQLTTLFKLANSFNLKTSEFIKELEKELPDKFSIEE